jgi:uncharacterized protein (TIGR03437 family)
MQSGSGWLTAGPGGGSSLGGAQAASPVTVTVNPQALAPGQYYGTVQVEALTAGNSPKTVAVSLTVLDTGKAPAPEATPSGMILVGQAGSANSNAQTVTLANHGNAALSYTSTVVTEDGQSWLVGSPAGGTVGANGTVQMNVQAALAGLGTGLWRGTLRVAFADGTVATVGVALVVTSATGSAASGNCTASAVKFQSPQDGFQVTVLQSVTLEILATDCKSGKPITSNAVVYVSVPDLPDPIQLVPQGNGGLYAGTWRPASALSKANLLGNVNRFTGGSLGYVIDTDPISGSVQAPPPAQAQSVGIVTSVQNGASNDRDGQITPGAWVALKGVGLAGSTAIVDTIPYQKTLSGTQVLLQNRPLPLYYASEGQVNALIPATLAPGTPQLAIVRDGIQSPGKDVLVTDLEPGLFSLDGSGTGQGAILIALSGLVAGPVTTSRPAQPVQRGDYISIYCTGLGALDGAAPQDGAPAPIDQQINTILKPKVTIAGVDSNVIFSGLAPTLVGAYVVNVQVPTTIAPGDTVPVTLTIGGISSNTVTIAVR